MEEQKKRGKLEYDRHSFFFLTNSDMFSSDLVNDVYSCQQSLFAR